MVLVPPPLVALNPSSCRARLTVIGRWPTKVSPSLRCKRISLLSQRSSTNQYTHRVIATSAHAAFDKAGQYFRIKIIHVPVDPVTREIDIRRVRRAV